MGVASTLGLASGINYEELVSKLIELERRPITILENRKMGIKEKMGALDANRTVNQRRQSRGIRKPNRYRGRYSGDCVEPQPQQRNHRHGYGYAHANHKRARDKDGNEIYRKRR